MAGTQLCTNMTGEMIHCKDYGVRKYTRGVSLIPCFVLKLGECSSVDASECSGCGWAEGIQCLAGFFLLAFVDNA